VRGLPGSWPYCRHHSSTPTLYKITILVYLLQAHGNIYFSVLSLCRVLVSVYWSARSCITDSLWSTCYHQDNTEKSVITSTTFAPPFYKAPRSCYTYFCFEASFEVHPFPRNIYCQFLAANLCKKNSLIEKPTCELKILPGHLYQMKRWSVRLFI